MRLKVDLFKQSRLLLGIFLMSLAGACAGPALITPSATPNQQATPTATAPKATFMAATATATPSATNLPTPVPTAVVAKDWTIYSNPNYVRGLMMQGDDLWAATEGGVVHWQLKEKKSRLYTTLDGLSEISASDVAFCPSDAGDVFVAHPNGAISVYQAKNDRWDSNLVVPPAEAGGLQALYCNLPMQKLYAGGSGGLAIWDLATQTWTWIGAKDGLATQEIRAVRAGGKTSWIAAGTSGAFLLLGQRVIPFANLGKFPTGSINDVAIAPDGSAWFAYSKGLIQYHTNTQTWTSYGSQPPNGLPFLSIDRLEFAPDGKLWIASSSEGVCPLALENRFCSTVYPALPGLEFTDLAINPDGTAYAGTNGGGIAVLMPDGIGRLQLPTQLADPQPSSLVLDGEGGLWVAGQTHINHFDPREPAGDWETIRTDAADQPLPALGGIASGIGAAGVWTFASQEVWIGHLNTAQTWGETLPVPLEGSTPFTSVLQGEQTTWFAASQSLFGWDGETLVPLPWRGLGQTGIIHAIYELHNTLWIGAEKGMWRCENAICTLALADVDVRQIASDGEGGLIMATSQGLFRRVSESITYAWPILLPDQLLSHLPVNAVAVDLSGGVWAGTNEGLFHFDGTRWIHITPADGLPSRKIKSIVIASDGAVWIAAVTQSGGALARFGP